MINFEILLKEGDLRSIGKSNLVVSLVDSQEKFDALFVLLFHPERKIRMRAGDAIEKITRSHPVFLKPHKKEILQLIGKATDKELKWHLALMVTCLHLSKTEIIKVWQILSRWLSGKNESKIVRVNALQSLFNLVEQIPEYRNDFRTIVSQVQKENIPSINARIKKLKKNKT
jgi:hypothetical protein